MSARSVCCRGSAVREPPVSRRKRWSSLPLISSTDSERTRAAASSMASGMPSSWQQIEASAGAFWLVTWKSGAHQQRAVDEQLHRLVRRQSVCGVCVALRDPAARATARDRSARPRCRALRGWSPGSARRGHCRRSASASLRAGVEQVLAVVEHQQQPLGLEMLDERLRRCGLPGSSFTPSTVATACGTRPGSASGGELDQPDAVRELLERRRPRPPAPGASCRCRRTRSASAGACLPSSALTSAISCSRPMKLVSCWGRLFGMRRQRLDRRKVAAEVRGAGAGTPAPGRARSLSRCAPRSRKDTASRQRVADQVARSPATAASVRRGRWRGAAPRG